MRKISIGILAHVDAGKTTLSEALMYNGGAIRRQGRVDGSDTFLDTMAIEKQRGITVFSKCARINVDEDKQIILVDTPGHIDFSAEAERTLEVLDAAILVIGGMDGVAVHAKDLWKLLRQSAVPVYIFINKTDIAGFDKDYVMDEIRRELSADAIDFSKETGELLEDIASVDEELMNCYLEKGQIPKEVLSEKIMDGTVIPCFFGSALQNVGVDGLLDAIVKYTDNKNVSQGSDFCGTVYKISYDDKGNRLTHLKVNSGVLKAKGLVNKEKVNEIRLLNGAKYESVQEAAAGEICAVTGLYNTHAGMKVCSGDEAMNTEMKATNIRKRHFKPVLSYALIYPDDTDPYHMLDIMHRIEDEQPECSVSFRESTKEIEVMLMGEIQTEIMTSLIKERYQIEVTFAKPKIAYKETVIGESIGIGHYEPLRHFADVRLRISELVPGSGIEADSELSEDILDRNWQRLILTHIKEKEHIGVLTGSPITDVKITLIDGKAHLKHTEGGDFREATYRAVRQGLMRAKNRLLEPYYDYVLTVPDSCVGRAISDLERMCGTYAVEAGSNGMTRLCGKVPVATMNGYSIDVASYTSGKGRLEQTVSSYEPCHNEEEVIADMAYDPEADTENPVHSVFCSHGAGHVVRWDELS